MKRETIWRRGVLNTSLAALAIAMCSSWAERSIAADEVKQQFYELRVYRVANVEKQAIVSDYLKSALIPALNRMGVERVGVFTVMPNAEADEQDLSIFVLAVFPNLEMFAAVNPTLEADVVYQQAAAPLHALGRKDPAYTRIESRLMKAFSGMPIMELPRETMEKTPRIFELRIYESHNDQKARVKVAMFNDGEMDVMREVKLGPVFYGETLIGPDVPNLIYMLSASDMEAHEEHWSAFRGHPEWDRMKNMPKYKESVSHITNYYLVPTEFSQI